MNYTITVTDEQLRLIELGCDLLARVMIGQSGDIARYLPLEKNTAIWDMVKQIEAVTKPACGLEQNASFGVGKFEKADTLFDIVETLRYQTGEKTVYNIPFHWNKKVPLIKVKEG